MRNCQHRHELGVLVVFNFLPGALLDGGRVLRTTPSCCDGATVNAQKERGPVMTFAPDTGPKACARWEA